MSIEPETKMDHIAEGEQEMHYLIQPRDKGFTFRMVTPVELHGTTNPWTGKPFGKEIKVGLRTRRLPEAKQKRDVLLGKVRELQHAARGADKVSLKSAEDWAAARAEDEKRGTGPDGVTVQDALEDTISALRARPKSKRPSSAQLRQFKRVAYGTGYLLEAALHRYLEDRAPGNPLDNEPLAKQTMNDAKTATRYLMEFVPEGACLQDIDRDTARRFRQDHLPSLPSKKGGGLKAGTVKKHVTLLSGVWTWAEERGLIPEDSNPWKGGGARLRKVKAKAADDERTIYTPEQARRLMRGLPLGSALGDLFRLCLVTSCRMNEVASLRVEAVEEDGSGFTIRDGKTKNARRYVPLISPARDLVLRRLEQDVPTGRLFPERKERASSGKVDWSNDFTRQRRAILGTETDGKLALHSARHTWQAVRTCPRGP